MAQHASTYWAFVFQEGKIVPKRMIDTDLWNDEEIVENFSAEDRYFWLYLLTNPHNNICGVLKNSPALIARDMGYQKEFVVELINRFETEHKFIYVDRETKEIFILNWYKHNWTKSPKIIALVDKELNNIKSMDIRMLIEKRKSIVCSTDTLSIPYPYPPNTNTISNSNTIKKDNNIREMLDGDNDFPDWLRKE